MRESGILLPIFSLPSKYGIGCFSKEAYRFIDFLKKAELHYWQVLPMGQTGYGDSPYQSFSAFAGNPYFIDLETLIHHGLLTEEECDAVDFGSKQNDIDYEKLYYGRYMLLQRAYERSSHKEEGKYHKFLKNNKEWLEDYALYRAIKTYFNEKPWVEWEEDIRTRKKSAIKKYKEMLKKEIDIVRFQQYIFWRQWKKLKKYANKRGVRIIGDIPIYVAFDSVDSWAHQELFQLDKNGYPTRVAGCPPDAFSEKGQLWGNPLYRWEKHKETGYQWWLARIRQCFQLYDVVRIDHFRGFDEYYSIPYGDKTAEFGTWEKGPGYSLFKTIKKKLGKVDIIAEDLGFLTDSVFELVEKTGFPGMKILEFAFDSREDSDYLPHNYEKNCVVYTGTHDNEPIQSFVSSIQKEDLSFALKYMNVREDGNFRNIHWNFIRLALSSTANLVIIPMQDYLGLGAESRINTPSTLGQNWRWRMGKEMLSPELAKKIRKWNSIYRRNLLE